MTPPKAVDKLWMLKEKYLPKKSVWPYHCFGLIRNNVCYIQ